MTITRKRVMHASVGELTLDGDGRTVTGMCAPYGEPALVRNDSGIFHEVIERGAFAQCMRGRPQYVQLQLGHDGQWVGRGDRWHDRPDGLAMDFRLDDTTGGETARYKIADGQAAALSVCFDYVAERREHPDLGPVDHVVSVRKLRHVALVAAGAYPRAQVTAMRSQDIDPEVVAWRDWLDQQRP